MSVDDERPRSNLGGMRWPQPLGRSEDLDLRVRPGQTGPPRGTRVADANLRKRPPRKKRQSKSPPKAAGREITIAGSFTNPFKTRADEIKAMKVEGGWEPSTDDFRDVGRRVLVVDNYLQILGAVLVEGDSETKAGTISRINIFTHANSDLIAFAGRISAGGMSAQVFLNVDTALSQDTLDNLNGEGVTFTIPSASKKLAAKKFTLADVRKRFSKDAVIVIYACKSGVDGEFLQRISDTFQVKVRGFSDLIGYFPKYDEAAKTIDRRHVGVGYKAAVVVSDFHDLDVGSKAVEKTPKP
jgi:hypothetical protein